jgi:hypothetical protein
MAAPTTTTRGSVLASLAAASAAGTAAFSAPVLAGVRRALPEEGPPEKGKGGSARRRSGLQFVKWFQRTQPVNAQSGTEPRCTLGIAEEE